MCDDQQENFLKTAAVISSPSRKTLMQNVYFTQEQPFPLLPWERYEVTYIRDVSIIKKLQFLQVPAISLHKIA